MSLLFLLFRDKFNLIIIIATCLLVYSTSSCNKQHDHQTNLNGIEIKVDIKRLEREVQQIQSPAEVKKFLQDNDLFARQFLQKGVVPDSVVESGVWRISQSTYIDTLTQQTDEYYGDMQDIADEFVQAFKVVKSHYPDFVPPAIYTVVTGFESDVYVSDSLIIVGLDVFLGDKAKYRMRDVPNYIFRRYRKEFIVPAVVMFLSNKYNETETDFMKKNMLSEMIYFGKTYYFMEKTLQNTADSTIIGYTGEEISSCKGNQDVIWGHFVENNLFFETLHDKINRYIGERPMTGEIGDECPGRVGRWLGWQIVKSYMESNPQVTLPNLMKDKDAKKIFEQSRYKPKTES
jgi:gliding motility-associated lipoprotein GldB